MEKWEFQRNVVYLFSTKQKTSETQGATVAPGRMGSGLR